MARLLFQYLSIYSSSKLLPKSIKIPRVAILQFCQTLNIASKFAKVRMQFRQMCHIGEHLNYFSWTYLSDFKLILIGLGRYIHVSKG